MSGVNAVGGGGRTCVPPSGPSVEVAAGVPAVGSRWRSDTGTVWAVVRHLKAVGFVAVERVTRFGELSGDTYFWHYTSLTGTTMVRVG